jgi:hypothetical protein
MSTRSGISGKYGARALEAITTSIPASPTPFPGTPLCRRLRHYVEIVKSKTAPEELVAVQ